MPAQGSHTLSPSPCRQVAPGPEPVASMGVGGSEGQGRGRAGQAQPPCGISLFCLCSPNLTRGGVWAQLGCL